MFGALLAGLGLFFVGLKMLTLHLRGIASRRLREAISQWTSSSGRGSVLGLLAGALIVNVSAITLLIASFVRSGLLKTRRAYPLILWNNVGGMILLFVALLDIKVVVLYLLGLSALFFAFDKRLQPRPFLQVLFGIALLFYGIQLITESALPLQSMDWVKTFMLQAQHSYLLAFSAGALLAFVVQSSDAVSLLAITLLKTHLLTLDQTLMVVYGTHLGSSLSLWLLTLHLKGTSKQIAMLQVFFNIVGCLIFVPLFYAEIYGGFPLVKHSAMTLAASPSQEVLWVVFLFNTVTALLLLLLTPACDRLLSSLFPVSSEEEQFKPQYLFDQALQDSETAMDLVMKEQIRLLQKIRQYVSLLQVKVKGASQSKMDLIHSSFASIHGAIQAFLGDLRSQNLSRKASERFSFLQNLQSLLENIEENLYQVTHTLQNSKNPETLIPLISTFTVGLDVMLSIAESVALSSAATELTSLLTLTADKSGLMSKTRSDYLSHETQLSTQDKSLLLYLTNLFERIVWSLNRMAALFEKQLPPAQTELLKSSQLRMTPFTPLPKNATTYAGNEG